MVFEDEGRYVDLLDFVVMKEGKKKILAFFIFESFGCHLLGSVGPYTLEQNC